MGDGGECLVDSVLAEALEGSEVAARGNSVFGVSDLLIFMLMLLVLLVMSC